MAIKNKSNIYSKPKIKAKSTSCNTINWTHNGKQHNYLLFNINDKIKNKHQSKTKSKIYKYHATMKNTLLKN